MADLRAHDRHTPAALTYVSAGSGNGGILLNLSEAGCALQLVAPPHLNTSIELELDLGNGYEPVHATGVAVWIDDTGCTGIRFVDLPESARTALRQWLEATREPEQARPAENPMAEIEALFAEASDQLGLTADASEQDSAAETDSFETRLYQLSTGAGLVALAEECRVRSGAAASAIALLTGRDMTCRASSGTGAPPAGARLDITSEKSFTAQCVNTGKVLKCSDATVDPRVNSAVCQRLGIRSVTAIPLMEVTTAVGVLEVFSPEREAFDDDCVTDLETLGELCVAFARARGEFSTGSGDAVSKTRAPSVITAQHNATPPSADSQARLSAAAAKAMAAVSAVAAMSPAPSTSSAPAKARSTPASEKPARARKEPAYAPAPTPYVPPSDAANEPELEVLAGSGGTSAPAVKEPAYAPPPTPYIPPTFSKSEPEIEVLAGSVDAPIMQPPPAPPEPSPVKFARPLAEAAAAPAPALERPEVATSSAPLMAEPSKKFSAEVAPLIKKEEELTSLADVFEAPAPVERPIAPERSVPPSTPSIAPAPGFAKRAVTPPERPKRVAPATAIPAKPFTPARPLHDSSAERALRRDLSSELPSFAARREQAPLAVSRGVLFAAAALILAAVIVISGWRIFRSSGTPIASASQPVSTANTATTPPAAAPAPEDTPAPSPDVKPQAASPKTSSESQKTSSTDASDGSEKSAVELQPVMTLAPGQRQGQQPATPEVAPPTVATSGGGSDTLTALMSSEPTRTVAIAAPDASLPSGPLRVSSAALESRLIRRIDPHYPDVARRNGLNGSVTLRVLISPDGTVRQVRVLEGPSVLGSAAREAVSQWRYRPYLVDGKPTEVETEMVIKFTARR